MKTAMLKTAFASGVALLAIILLVPAYIILEAFFPSGRGGDRLLPGLITVFACMYVADRTVSWIFRRTHLSDESWTVLGRAR